MSEPWWRAATLAEREVADGEPPTWWRHIETTLQPGTRSTIADRDDAADADVTRGALRLVAPFVRRAHRTLREHPSATAPALRSLADTLARELIELARPAVALELVATRVAGGWGPEELERETAAALRDLGRAEGARALLDAHPSLARMIVERVRLAVGAGRELLDRIESDLPRVRAELLGGEDPGAVTDVALAGDAHDGGRRVARVSFESGARVVLKPRSLSAERAFAGALHALNALGFEPPFAPPATIEAGPHHGWQAWAQASSCTTRGELERYFVRLGGQLALLHALRATDMHQENVLACGEHPALVDLETLLHPRLGCERANVVDPLIAETGLDCVLRVGLLPRADVAFGVDIGGLGRDPEALHEAEQFEWAGAGSQARLVARRQRLQAGDNAPRLDGRPVRPHEHVDALACGFRDAYRLLVEHREQLLAPGGALAALEAVRTRVVLRPTKVYVDLLRRATQDLAGLDDGVARERALDILWRGAERRPELRAAAPAERHDLWLGDVPKFTTVSGTADGYHHALGPMNGMLSPHRAPGPEIVRRLDEADLERQLSFLRSSVLAAAAPGAAPPGAAPPGAAAPGEARAVPAAARVRTATEAGERLRLLALHDGDMAGWLALVESPAGGSLVLRPVGPGLRHGQAGIALFLWLLAEHDERSGGGVRTLALAAWRRLVAQLAAHPELTDEDRDGLLLALDCGLGVQPERSALAGWLSEIAPPREPEDLEAPPALHAGIESPALGDGLAGIGMQYLAAEGDERAVRVVLALWPATASAGQRPPGGAQELRL